VAPQPGRLGHVSASVRTPLGAVSIRIEQQRDEYAVMPTIPAGARAEIDLRAIDPTMAITEVGAGTHRFTVHSVGAQL